MKNYLSIKFTTNIVVVILSIVSLNAFGQNCNGLNISLGQDVEYCNGASITLTATMTGGPTGVGAPIYTWVFDSDAQGVPDQTLTNATGNSYTIPSFNNNLEGIYIVTVTYNGSSCSDGDQISVQQPSNNSSFNLDPGNNITSCQGLIANINSSVSNVPVGGTVTYSWISNIGGYSSTSADPSFYNLPVGTYTFTGTATVNGCIGTEQIQVTVNANPAVPTFTIPATGCPGVAIPISGFTPISGFNYTWNDSPSLGSDVNGGSTSNPTLTFTNGGTFSYTVTAIDSITGCSSTSIPDQINITNLGIYPPDINYVNTTNYLSGQSYNGVYTYDVCDATGVVEFLITNNTNTNNASTIYSYSGANGTQISNYTSSNITPNLGNNYFTITGTYNGCTVSQTFNIYVGSNPVVSVAVGNSLNVCDGGSVSALITPGVISPGTTYNLYFSDNPGVVVQTLTDISVPTYANPYTFTSGSCGYSVQGNNCVPNFPNVFYAYVVATNACEVSCGPSTPITVLNEPEAGFNISQTTTCVNTNVTLSTTAVPGNQFQGNAVSGFTCTNAINSQWSISPNTGYTVVNGSLGSTSPNWQNWNGTNNVTLSFNTPGTYSITQKVQSNAGCGLRDSTRTITIQNSSLTITSQPLSTQTICSLGTASPLVVAASGGTGSLSYQWYSSTTNSNVGGTLLNGQTNPTLNLGNLYTLGTTYYYAVVTPTNGGCSAISNTSSVSVISGPIATISPTLQGLCLNGVPNPISVSYSGGTGTPTYQWYSNTVASNTNGTLISGATSSSYYPPTNATGSKYYYCIISLSGSGCSVNSSVSRVIVNLTPSLTSMGFVDQTLCLGGTASSLYVEPFIGGYGTPTYQWYSNTSNSYTGGTMLVGETSQTFIPQTNTIGNKYYYCQVTYSANGCGTVNSPISLVSVLADPVISTQPLSSQTICTGGNTVPLSFVASGGIGTFSYQWYSNSINSNVGGIPITGQTSATLSLGALTNIATTYYYSTISQTGNGCTSNSTNTSSVTVIADPVVTVTPTLQQACIGGVLAPLTVSSTGGSGTSQYQWYYNTTGSNISGTLISGATSPTLSVSTTASLNRYYYCVITRSISGCTVNSPVAQVIINSAPAISSQPTATQTICVGGNLNPLTVALQAGTGSGAFSYQWYSNTTSTNTGGTIIPGATTLNYSPPVFNTAGSYYYYCVVTDAGIGCGAITSQVATVIVVADPTVTAPIATQTICQAAVPTPLNVTASGGTGTFLYQWYSNTLNNTTSGTAILGASTSTYTPPTSTVGTLYYYCIVTTAASGCSVTSTASAVVVNPAPTFTTQPASSNVCVGGTTTQMCVTYSNGTGTPSYQWYSNTANNTTSGTPIPSANSSCFTPPSTTAGTTYYYAIITLTGGGCSIITSNTATVAITPDPIIASQPIATQSICEGGNAAPLTVALQAATGIGAFTYQWYSSTTGTNSGGTIISGATAATFTPPIFTTAGTFSYYCIVTNAGNGCGAVTSQVASVIVVADPTVTAPLATQTICQNATPTALTVTASGGTGTFLYQWFSNQSNNNTGGTAINGANNPTYTPPTLNIGTTFYYCVTTTSASGCSVASSTAVIVVNPAPAFTTQPTPSNVCVGGTPTQMCVAYSNGTGTPSYQWYSNTANNTTSGTLIPSATSSCFTPPSTTAGTTYYYAIISLNGGGCSIITSNTAAVVITADPIASSTPPTQTICVGGTVPTPFTATYTNGVGAPTYQWNFVGTPITAIAGATASTYTPPIFSTTGTFNYNVTINTSGSGCTSSTSSQITVVVVPDPTITIPLGTQTLCQNATPAALTVAASGGSGTLTYQWFSSTTNSTSNGILIPGATNSTYTPPTSVVGTFYYYCVVTTPVSGCSVTSATSTLIVIPAPTFATQPTSSTVCVGGTPSQMCVTYINGTGTPSYQWYSNSANTTVGATAISGATTSCHTPPSSAAGTTYYYVVITLTGGGCSSITSNTAAVIITPDPVIATQPTANQTFCVGGSSAPLTVALQASTGIGAFTYQWFSNTTASNTGGTTIVGATAATYNPPVFNTAGTFYYYCLVTDAGNDCGTVASQVATVIVVADPTISTQPLPTQTICVGGTIPAALNVAYSGGVGTPTYQWYTGSPASSISGATNTSYTPPVFNTAGTSNYYATISLSGSGCDVLTSTNGTVNIVADPIVTISSGASYCQYAGSVVPLSVVVSGGQGTPSYLWYSNTTNSNTGGTIISGANAISYSPPVATTGTTFYYCVITQSGANCGVNSSAAQITVTQAPIFTTQPITTQSVCTGGSTTQLNVAYNYGAGTASYQWYANTTNNYAGGTPIAGQTTSSFTPPSTATGTTYYYCIISFSAASGCSMINSNISEVVILSNLQTASITPATATAFCQGGNIVLNANTGSGLTYQWKLNGTNIAGATSASYLANTGGSYTVVVTNASSCSATSNATVVTVNALPAATITPSSATTFCQGGSVALNANTGTGLTYQWKLNGTNIAGATSASYLANTSGSYTVVVTNASSCSATSNATVVTVNALPAATITPATTTTFCQGGSVILNANAANGLTYQWYLNGTVITGATSALYTANASGSYTVVVTNASSCSDNSNATVVTVNALPTTTITPSSATTFCQGGSVALNANTGTGLTYQWKLNGTNITGATASSYTANASGSYTVVVTNASSCSATSNATVVTVNALPAATITPATTTTFCQGGSVVLNANTANGLTYQWYINGVVITGATSASYTANTSGSYTVVITNTSSCSAYSNATVVTVNDIPTATITPASATTFCGGGSVVLNANTGTGLTYQWKLNGANITGATSASYTANASGAYSVAVTNSNYCSLTSTDLTVSVTTQPSISSQPMANQTICVGGTPGTLSVSLLNTAGTPEYQWWSSTTNSTIGASQITGATSSTYVPSSENIGIAFYFCTVSFTSSNCGLITSNIASVSVVEDPHLSIQPLALQTFCVGGTANTLSVIASGGTGTFSYQWYNALTNSAIFGANSITFTPGTFYSVSDNSYYVQVSQTGAGCNTMISNNAQVNVVADPIAVISSGSTYCQNSGNVNPLSIIFISGGEGTPSYQWYSNSTGGNTSGNPIAGATGSTYTPPVNSIGTIFYYCLVTQTGFNCTANSTTSQIEVTAAPTFSTQPASTQSVCVGGVTTQLHVEYIDGAGTPTYQWYSNTVSNYSGGTVIPTATSSVFNPSSGSPGTTYYYCSISFSEGGCSTIYSNIARVIIYPDAIIAQQPLTSQVICNGGAPIPITATIQPSTGMGTFSYQWFRNDTPLNTGGTLIANATNATYYPPSSSYSYYCLITDGGNGCGSVTSEVATVTKVPDPIITEEINFIQTICPYESIINAPTVMINFAPEIAPPIYTWFEVDLNGYTPIPNSNNNSYTPENLSNNLVQTQCTIEFNYPGCDVLLSSLSKLIFDEKGIDCYPNLDIPGAISPNNDGANDYWTISEIELYSGYEINIFNSFGQSIYQVKNTPANWDGTWNGQNLPNGDYFYAIKLLELNRTIFGTISLVR